eukprot:TRINITY_DN11254_c0_g2_i3.p1 TRINITY_DN11254_c0_g2~~TRINITY_DN11254_c0_g2_i3.p1  ORF type:complete len:143 (+),score=33.35 TRINITY_DN11254_c0_g2_i3:67-495(+)
MCIRDSIGNILNYGEAVVYFVKERRFNDTLTSVKYLFKTIRSTTKSCPRALKSLKEKALNSTDKMCIQATDDFVLLLADFKLSGVTDSIRMVPELVSSAANVIETCGTPEGKTLTLTEETSKKTLTSRLRGALQNLKRNFIL